MTEGPIPEFPALAVDSSSGRILPISEEQRAARREAAIRALRAISEITDETDTDDRWEEIYRNIDESRPHRKLLLDATCGPVVSKCFKMGRPETSCRRQDRVPP